MSADLLARAWLGLSALLYLGLGLWLGLAPDALAAVDLRPETGTARAELRAMYGGLELGLAVFLVACAWVPGWLEAGLGLTLASLLGLAAGRSLGILRDDPGGVMYRLLAVELGWAALTLVIWWWLRHQAGGAEA